MVFLTSNGFAATIKGIVTDKQNGEPVIGAVVMLHGTKYGTTTGLDGSYKIADVPAGAYDLEIRFPSYEVFTQKITLADGAPMEVSPALAPSSKVLSEVEIKSKHKNGSDEQARSIEKNSDNLLNIVSARTIEILPDITIANVLQRVSGVTVQRNANGDARYAIIRGMDKRYNYTLVNGIKIPSSDDKMRYVPMDIFPAELVDRVEVIKSLTPSMEGDAVGGAMNLVMKNAPDHLVLYASAATGYNQTLMDRNFQGFSRTGFALNDPIQKYGQNYQATANDFQRRTGDFSSAKAPANGLMSFTLGNRITKDKKLGAIISGSYQNTFKGSDAIFFLPSIQPGVNNTPAITDLETRKYSTQETRAGLHSKVDYEINNKNSISLYGLLLQLNELQTRNVIDTTVQINRVGPGTGPVDFTQRAAMRKQAIENVTLQGKHLVADKFKMDYTLAYSKATMDVPDMTELHTTTNAAIDTNGNHIPAPVLFKSFKHSWERTTDEDRQSLLNFTYTPEIAGKEVEFMAGGMYRNKTRDNRYNDYTLSPSPINQPFTNIWGATMTMASGAEMGDLNYGLNYSVTEDIMAYYGQGKVQLNDLQLLGGVRVENTRERYRMNQDTNVVKGAVGELRYTDALPSVHLKYALSKKENLRLSYFESISRPGFFEIVPYRFDGEVYTEIGNYNLNHTVAHNFDLRYEWFPKGIDQLLAGVFYKNISNPIEYVLTREATKASAGDLQAQNLTGKPAINYGVELVVAKYFHNFGVSANYTYTHSAVTSPQEYRYLDNLGNITSRTDQVTRPLQGQSAHVANLAVIYKDPKFGLDAHLSWVYTGRRIQFLSLYEGLDYWQRATSFFDFSCEKRIVKHLSVYAKVNNLLNAHAITEMLKPKDQFTTGTYSLPYQTLKTNTLVDNSAYGRNYLIGIRYKLD